MIGSERECARERCAERALGVEGSELGIIVFQSDTSRIALRWESPS